jgi:hypothetical protein
MHWCMNRKPSAMTINSLELPRGIQRDIHPKNSELWEHRGVAKVVLQGVAHLQSVSTELTVSD